MNSSSPETHDDGLEWLREVRRRMLEEAEGDMKKLGDRYRKVQQEHPERSIDPRQVVAEAVRQYGHV